MKLSKGFVSGAAGSVLQPDSRTAPRILSRLDWLGLSALARQLKNARIQLRLWDGTTISTSELPPVGLVTIRDRATLCRLLLQSELAYGEGYANGRIDVAGDLTGMIESVNLALANRPHRRGGLTFTRISERVDPATARKNIHVHYDLGNEFYRLWLDDAMVYTCAYFERPDIGLEAAQQAKLEYVCRKLELAPGDRVIEAGCGWGALAIYMARHYGVHVLAYNISQEQLAYARNEAARYGVADRVTFVDGDFRSITGACDVFVSIGMLEHVGIANYGTLGAVIDRVLDKRRGRGLLHFIGRNHPKAFDAWMRRYIFPGAYAPVLSEVTGRVFESYNICVTDVENLRPHYARTLHQWRARFEQHAMQVARMFDDRFVRMWRLYLASAEACFRSGDLQLFQITFGRSADNTHRWTREDLYALHRESGGASREDTRWNPARS